MPKNQKVIQTSFLRKPERNLVSLEEFKKTVSEKPKQHEKKFMNDIMRIAASFDLPCIHIQYYCGNKFFPTCSGTKTKPHKPTRAFCPVCQKPILAVCTNRINRGLSGHYDILGISWAIETKHKVNKGKQKIKLADNQKNREIIYDIYNIPNIAINESDGI